jgi:hypothetical protein
MLATIGFVAPEIVGIPGEQFSFDFIPDYMNQIVLGWISFLEACSFPALANMNKYDRAPSDFGFNLLGIFPTDPVKQATYTS